MIYRIEIGDYVVDAGVTVAQRVSGELEFDLSAYGLGHSNEARWAKRKGADPLLRSRAADESTPQEAGSSTRADITELAGDDDTARIPSSLGGNIVLPEEKSSELQGSIDTLQSIVDGNSDGEDLDALLDKIDAAASALEAAGLAEQYDELIGKAAAKWAELDQKANG